MLLSELPGSAQVPKEPPVPPNPGLVLSGCPMLQKHPSCPDSGAGAQPSRRVPSRLPPRADFRTSRCVREGSPATHSHPKTGDDCCGRGQAGRRAHVPAPRLESSAAPDATCNLRRLISSSSRLESLNQENNILFLRPCASCTSDHTPARRVRSSGQGL